MIRSKISGTILTGSTPTPVLTFSPTFGGLGSRQQSIASVFTDFRIKDAVIRFLVSPGANGSISAMGVLDDSSGGEGDAPVNYQDVTELRCSATSFGGQTVPVQFRYSPTNKTLWYKTYNGSGDPRFVSPGVLYVSTNTGTGTNQFAYELDVTIVYKGAVDINSNGLAMTQQESADVVVVPSTPSAKVTNSRGMFSRS